MVGATGRTGRAVVEAALQRELRVIAVSRSGSPIDGAESRRLDIVAASGDAVAAALEGADAVLSTLGHRTAADDGVLELGAERITDGMQTARIDRLVVISAAPVTTTPSPARPRPPRRDPGEGPVQALVLTPIIRRVFQRVYADTARMEDVIRASATRWTLVRPPRLLDGPARSRYRIAVDRNLPGGRSVRRADLAAFLIDAIADDSLVGHGVGIAD